MTRQSLINQDMSDNFYLYDERGLPIYEVTRTDKDYRDTSCTFIVKEVCGWQESSSGKFDEPYELEDVLDMTVKWDGCSHLRFGEIDEDGRRDAYLHICGAENFKKHIRMIHDLYNLAYKHMGREPYDESEEWDEL